MRRLAVLGPHLRPLLDAEAVLLVDDHETEVREDDAILQQGVRPDEYVGPSRRERLENPAALLRTGGSRKYVDLHRKPLRKARDGCVVLPCEYLGRGHDAGLEAVVVGQQHRHQRHDRLAAAHVALQQAVHLAARDRVGANLLHHALLRPSERERKPLRIEAVETLAHAREYESVTALRACGAKRLYVELDAQQLVELEAVLRLLQEFLRLREVDVVERVAERQQPVAAAHALRERVVYGVADDAPEAAYDVVEPLCAECPRELLGHGIDPLQAALARTRDVLLHEFRLGVDHRQLAAEEGRTAEDHVFASHLETLLHPLYALEPYQFGTPRTVGDVYREAALAPLARQAETRDAAAELHIGRGRILIDVGYAVDLRAVYVAEGEVVQHVAHRHHAYLAFEQAGTGLAHTRDILYAVGERISHNANLTI